MTKTISKDSEERLNRRRIKEGVVTSNKMQKTIVVQIRDTVRHPKFGKVISRFNKFKVHDEKNEAGIGDRVRIQESRPLSRDKRWRLVKIVQKAPVKDKIVEVVS